jgi:hypothetical protein
MTDADEMCLLCSNPIEPDDPTSPVIMGGPAGTVHGRVHQGCMIGTLLLGEELPPEEVRRLLGGTDLP